MNGWDHWEDWDDWRKQMKRIMRGFILPVREEFLEGSFPIDISETEGELIIKADLPGFEKTDIAIRATENSIDIVARQKKETREQKESYFRAERSMGAVRRCLTLPVAVDPESAQAEMNNGVLTVDLKKKEKNVPFTEATIVKTSRGGYMVKGINTYGNKMNVMISEANALSAIEKGLATKGF